MRPSDSLILRLLASGRTPQQVAATLEIPVTVVDAAIREDLERQTHVAAIYRGKPP